MTLGQLDMFDGVRPIAANADPETSHQAARHLADSGRLVGQRLDTLRALAEWLQTEAPPTSFELAKGSLHWRYLFARRLADLEDGGFVEKLASRDCRVTGERAVTWTVTDRGSAALEAQR